ncbi:MAG: chemotaxis protein CheW, partial [Nitrospina sp.]|nr:chemotaxis protein CheW [Nitrospina sp.]
EDKLPMNVVVRTKDGVVSLLVDEIGDVLEVPDDVYERPPETIPQEVRNLVLGVYKLEGRLLLILDSEKAVNVSTGAVAT